MGFKTDTSFLRFLSMGAIGARQTMQQLRIAGFEPIELERYCASNKIWMTKVKRLRLPDLLCVRTGLRLEVRAKSDLKIRMSDAPNNADRRWDSGLRDNDVTAFIAMRDAEDGPVAADEAVFLSVASLRASVNDSKLGPPKSASEGAERDRTWPCVVPSRSGRVVSVDAAKLIVEMGGDGNPPRRQTYTLNGKNAYVRNGDDFVADASILAGAPTALADLATYRNQAYDPLAELAAADAVDRYAAVKALPYRADLRAGAVPALESLLRAETEERVALEAAGSAATLGSGLGQDRVNQIVWGEGRTDLRMEAILILTELGSLFAKNELTEVAGSAHFQGDEIRQAAIWGLGKAGLKAYDGLIPYIDDDEDNVALHAIVGFGPDTPENVIRQLAEKLRTGSPRTQAAASEALRLIGSRAALLVLKEVAEAGSPWALATMGRFAPQLVREALEGNALLAKMEPLMLLSEHTNWLAKEDREMDLAFLAKQNL